jgi:hypothetical protein
MFVLRSSLQLHGARSVPILLGFTYGYSRILQVQPRGPTEYGFLHILCAEDEIEDISEKF